MDKEFLKFLVKDGISTNIGPNTKEILLQQAESEYCNGNMIASIFYQTYSLYQSSQERYNQSSGKCNENKSERANKAEVETLMAEMNAKEISEFSSNSLMQYVSKSLTKMSQKSKIKQASLQSSNSVESCNFLKDITSPAEGITKLIEICQKLPEEWTIIQLCKGPRAETTYSIFPKIHESDAAIYMTLIKHGRSSEYSTPICLRFSSAEQKKLYESFGGIVSRFQQCVKIDPKEVNTTEAKRFYWSLLDELNQFIATTCTDLCNFFYPWNFLFTGIAYSKPQQILVRQRWSKVDEFCDMYGWESDARVLLSLAASNAESLDLVQIEDICSILTTNSKHHAIACDMLKKMQTENDRGNGNKVQHFPCILIVDERLDHFFWEEINVQQEFTRVNSIQCLYRLYNYYKSEIKHGYLCVNITDGGCLLNPDKNLPKMESRMVSFFEYWTPHWTMLVGQRPTQDELFNKYLSRSCYVYAGHGSGLQYINGRKITKHQMHCVVFLFGCDSSRLHSSGLYSELVGPHLYYQAAMCPALVGTLMPGLDCNMDRIATEILSRWIVPKSTNVLPWNEIDERAWIKEFIIKPKTCMTTTKSTTTIPPSVATTPNYNVGSLCTILARVHQRVCEPKLYNTVPYVCRGLPVWNCNVEPLNTSTT
ncbi:separin [Lucilia cuprina]|uniref:separin n=1 Tax=Lucilia cuprina TaxID=7375 RepID=UPI001F06A205|nr:separin [Lucilia cuprina]